MQNELSRKKMLRGWYFYDWANSAYALVINATMFPIYYSMATRNGYSDYVQFMGQIFLNSALYSYVIALSFIVISILTPLLGGIADYSGSKKLFMRFFCYLGSAACVGLAFFNSGNLGYGLLCSALANIGFSGSLVFYNAYLPEIAEQGEQDAASAKGYAMGYAGSSLLLIGCLVAVMKPEFLGLNRTQFTSDADWFAAVAPFSFAAVGIWWAGFAQITFARLPHGDVRAHDGSAIIYKGFRELAKVWRALRKQKVLKLFLTSFFFFSMGVQTILLMAVFFGKSEIGVKSGDLIATILIIQFVAIAGAWLFAKLSAILGKGRIAGTGNVRALIIAVVIWIGICFGGFFVNSTLGFFIEAALVGLVMGGIQSLARATYSKLLPETDDHASYFSFMDVCEKVGIVIGMFSYGAIADLTGSMRNAIAALALFFTIGLIMLLLTKKNLQKGMAES